MKTPKSIYKSLECRVKSAIYARKDFRTSRHIVVFESDDWGSIRMSNKADWNALLQKGYAVDKRPYERFDTLESPQDVEALFEVLRKHKDSQGRHPVITANMLMANPDFDKIRKHNFQEYFYEPIADTYSRYFGSSQVLDLMKQGYAEGLIMPQSHGREHFNIAEWIKALQRGDEDVMKAFDYGMCGIAPKAHPEEGNHFMVALRATDETDQKVVDESVKEGLELFNALWGFSSKTFVAPCYAWNGRIEKILAEHGVQLIQSSRVSKPVYQQGATYRYAGQHNQYGQTYSIRNCAFEPANAVDDEADKALSQIKNAFDEKKIAVFSTHRINYVGGLDENNRTKNLKLLDKLLTGIEKQYSDVEFWSSDKLIYTLV